MRKLKVYIEIKGYQTLVGLIVGNNSDDAIFTYDSKYLISENSAPISVSLPLQKNSFSPQETRNYFESLLKWTP